MIFNTPEEIEAEVAAVARSSYWFYYDHAERKILEDYNAGMVKCGMAIWY